MLDINRKKKLWNSNYKSFATCDHSKYQLDSLSARNGTEIDNRSIFTPPAKGWKTQKKIIIK